MISSSRSIRSKSVLMSGWLIFCGSRCDVERVSPIGASLFSGDGGDTIGVPGLGMLWN
jgi:hypothetical protein